MKEHVIIFTGGNAPRSLHLDKALLDSSYICAADSGLDTAKRLGVSVEYAIGDFDSVSDPALLTSLKHTRLSPEKDISDTEALLLHMKEKGISRYTLVGGGEGRFDHLIHLYALFTHYGPPLRWITEKEELILISDEQVIPCPEGATVSFLPSLITGTSYVDCASLQWPLKHFRIDSTHMSLSNRAAGSMMSLRITGDPVFVSFLS